ncbi:MAG: ACP S-malonyltransferase [Peptococcaceae bacterium]|nr:ACP S-malonyltransferase [Peptococcaceae bacterium]
MKTGFVFPGQGSQKIGMGYDIYQNHAESREIFDIASDALGMDMAGLCFKGPEEELRKTVNAQPAILTASIALYKAMLKEGMESQVMAGHSLGEYSALVAAGAIDFVDAVKIVMLRGKYMQEAVPLGEGGMLAVLGLDISVIDEVCLELSQKKGNVEAVNLNSPGQVVIAGDNISLSAAAERLTALGARRCIPLTVSAPFHSSMMKPAGDNLMADLAMINIKMPKVPVLSNVTAEYHNFEDIRKLLISQISSPVRWEECVRKMVADGVGRFVEVGPGKVLSGLIKKIDSQVEIFNVEDQITLDNTYSKTG